MNKLPNPKPPQEERHLSVTTLMDRDGRIYTLPGTGPAARDARWWRRILATLRLSQRELPEQG
jgi:hypothetical protein